MDLERIRQAPIEVRMLVALDMEGEGGLFWKPLKASRCRVLPEDDSSEVDSKLWTQMLRDLEAEGHVERFRDLVPRFAGASNRTRLYFRITPKGQRLLKELGF